MAFCGVKWHIPEEVEIRHLKKLRKKLYEKRQNEGIVFVTGKGHHKTSLQKAVETVEEWLAKLKRYTRELHICGDRNSYCKTNHDATFMHMKEDHMRNGQLKPGYNVNVAASEEFIIGNYISAARNDVHTLIPFMEYLKRYKKIRNIVADSGYESEENYCYFETLSGIALYVKASNHEQKKSGNTVRISAAGRIWPATQKQIVIHALQGNSLLLTMTRSPSQKVALCQRLPYIAVKRAGDAR